MRPLGRLLVLLTILVAAGSAAAADGDPPGRIGRVARLAGAVHAVAEDGSWVVLPLNRPLTTGDRVVTESDGRAAIQVGSSTFRLGPGTDVRFEQLDDDVVRLRFDQGELALHLRSEAVLGEFSVRTDEGAFVPRRVGEFRFDRTPGSRLSAMSWSGELLLEAHDSSLPIGADQRAEIWQEGPRQATHYRMLAIPADDFADWVLSQDKDDDRVGASAAQTAASVPGEMTGAADLSQYGRWSSSDDYGTVWTPDPVPSGWAPYRDGAWSWIAPWGWTWIDASPWGFAPFHYGRWVWIGGHWAWVPGAWGPRPVYAPALVGWLGGPGFALGGVPAVGWVPLAWDEPFYPPYWYSPFYWQQVNGPAPPPPRPPRKGIEPVRSRPLGDPSGQRSFANRNAPGGLTIVPASGMTQRAPPATPPAALPALRTPAPARSTDEMKLGPPHVTVAPAVGRSTGGASPRDGRQ